LSGSDTALRLDKWLWYARFFKTRVMATRAVAGGRFRLDGEVMSKPHRAAIIGQTLTFAQGANIRVIRIVALGSRRGPASEATLLYEDLAPLQPKSAKTKVHDPDFEAREKGAGRPTKRERRLTDRLKPGL
jgi:ribosome-associated heat shock protein Hsp15